MKDFNKWHEVKQRLDKIETPPTFREREIWWCSVGVNVGFEIFGKDDVFTRPVLVVRKFGKYTFLGAPLTSSKKTGYFHYPYSLKDEEGSILFDQIRTYDIRRCEDKIKKVDPADFEKIKQAMKTRFTL